MNVASILAYITTGRFIAGLISGVLAATGVVGPEWTPIFQALFGPTTPTP